MMKEELDDLVEFAFTRICQHLVGRQGQMESFGVIAGLSGEREIIDTNASRDQSVRLYKIMSAQHMSDYRAVAWLVAHFSLTRGEVRFVGGDERRIRLVDWKISRDSNETVVALEKLVDCDSSLEDQDLADTIEVVPAAAPRKPSQ